MELGKNRIGLGQGLDPLGICLESGSGYGEDGHIVGEYIQIGPGLHSSPGLRPRGRCS